MALKTTLGDLLHDCAKRFTDRPFITEVALVFRPFSGEVKVDQVFIYAANFTGSVFLS